MERRLAAILAADVVGYSTLVRADEEGTLATLRSLRADITDPYIAAHNGRIFKLVGDGILAEFASAVDAVRVALKIQKAMAGRNAALPETRHIVFRIGINVGDVVIEGEDVLGDGVNIASRLEGLAPAGGICVSRAVHDQLVGKLEAEFVALGPQELKNIPEPVDVWRVETGVELSAAAANAGADRPSVAVLPFENMSDDRDQEFLADGIVEDVITALSRFRWLLVIARNSTYIYKGTHRDIRRIGRELGARYVLEGSVRRAGDRLRVTAQLIEAETGAHIWADRYDRLMADLFDVQDELTVAIVTAIEPELGAHERGLARRRPTEDLSAWQLYQRGETDYLQMSDKGHASAVRYFQAACDRDPDFALAFSGLARMHAMDVVFGRTADREKSLDAGIKLATKALDLDTRCDDGYRSLGLLLVLAKRIPEALETLDQGIALNPNSAILYFNRTQAYLIGGRFDEAIADVRTAMRLSPTDPMLWLYRIICGIALLFRKNEGDLDQAAIEIRAARSAGRPGWMLFFSLALLRAMEGDEKRAGQEVARALEAKPDLTLTTAFTSLPLPEMPSAILKASETLASLGLPRD